MLETAHPASPPASPRPRPDGRRFRLDLAELRGARAPDRASRRWSERVRVADPDDRHYLREALISLNAFREISRDTGRTEFAFEALQNFPAFDLLRTLNRRTPLARSPELAQLFREGSLPDLRTPAALALERLPPGTLGHEYALYVKERKLDNAFLEWLKVDDVEKFLAFRLGHLHDLWHFLLGYESYDPIGEMEIEAFLLAQTRGVNHVLFISGYLAFLTRSGRFDVIRAAAPRLRAAFELGSTATNFVLARWEELLERPIDDVKRELGVHSRPLARRDLTPKETPKLAHVVLNVPDRREAELFYTRVFGYEVVARDESLGVTFLSAGNDHHTIALGESLGSGPLGALRGALRLVPRGVRLLKKRLSSEHTSTSGRKTVLPPRAIVQAALRPGLMHMGFRVSDERELNAYRFVLMSAGVKVEWAVNHDDLIKGLYFKDAAGNLCEIFCDGQKAKQMLADVAANGGLAAAGITPGETHNYELDLDAELG